MKLFFDTEFTGLHKDTTLISLGIVTEDLDCFYAILTDYDKSQVNDWIQANVLNNLSISKKLEGFTKSLCFVRGTKKEVRKELLKWLDTLEDDYFELVSDVCHYDMVLFVDLFGTAFDLPLYISPCCYDINQDIYHFYSTDAITMQNAFDINREELLLKLSKQTTEDIYCDIQYLTTLKNDKHNSLYDAIIIKYLYELF